MINTKITSWMIWSLYKSVNNLIYSVTCIFISVVRKWITFDITICWNCTDEVKSGRRYAKSCGWNSLNACTIWSQSFCFSSFDKSLIKISAADLNWPTTKKQRSNYESVKIETYTYLWTYCMSKVLLQFLRVQVLLVPKNR